MTRMAPWAALLLLPTMASAAPNDPDVRIDPRADAVMHKMSDYMSSLQTIRLRTESTTDYVTPGGQKIQSVAAQQMTVKRPNGFRSERQDPIVDATVRYDGKELSIYGKRTGYYAVAPMPPTLTAAIDVARSRYDVDAPAGDLFVEDPYGQLMEDVQTGDYIGLEPIDGVPSHHLAFRGREVDWQIWVADGPQPFPLRYAITSKLEKSQPEFVVQLSHWQPNVTVPVDFFTFTPPPGATRIKLEAAKPTHHGRRGAR
jgi:hypothetical protein